MIISGWLENKTKETLICAVISAAALLLSITGAVKNMMPADPAWAAIVLCGVPIIVGASRAVLFEHDIKADLLVSLALISSVAAGEFFAAGEVALIMQIGSLLEDYTSGRAEAGIEKLIRMTPQTARVKRGGVSVMIAAEEVTEGDILDVIAGEIVPVDGTILAGETTIDQSLMTGESIPSDKRAGDHVFGGTVNQFGTFTMRADTAGRDSSLQRMIRLAEEARENKAPVVKQADRWASWLVVSALSCALLTWLFTGRFMRAVTVLVVFCPCAFILATPTAVLAGIANAARYGIMIRSGAALEKLSAAKIAAFDKTGTLTCGKPCLSAAVSCNPSYTDTDILRYLALSEQKSEHPLGKAIVDAYKTEGGLLSETDCFKVLQGRGISSLVEGKNIVAGKTNFMLEQGISTEEADAAARLFYDAGATLVYLGIDGELAGFAALADRVRDEAKAVIDKLKEIGITPLLLTGDNEAAARSIADKVGICEVHAALLPEDKMRIIKQKSTYDSPISMIGDGVNDALALTAADAGIAMGGIGSDIAIEASDAVLVGDEIKRLPYLFRLTRKVMINIKTNIIASLIINASAVFLSASGILTPVTGALWHNFGSVFVVVNAARLLCFKDRDI